MAICSLFCHRYFVFRMPLTWSTTTVSSSTVLYRTTLIIYAYVCRGTLFIYVSADVRYVWWCRVVSHRRVPPSVYPRRGGHIHVVHDDERPRGSVGSCCHSLSREQCSIIIIAPTSKPLHQSCTLCPVSCIRGVVGGGVRCDNGKDVTRR